MKNGKPKVAIVHDWLVAYAVAWLGWTWFARVRKGFADVL